MLLSSGAQRWIYKLYANKQRVSVLKSLLNLTRSIPAKLFHKVQQCDASLFLRSASAKDRLRRSDGAIVLLMVVLDFPPEDTNIPVCSLSDLSTPKCQKLYGVPQLAIRTARYILFASTSVSLVRSSLEKPVGTVTSSETSFKNFAEQKSCHIL